MRAPALDTEGRRGPPQFGGPVHAVKVSNDGLVYVADRPNRRVQVFTPDGKYVTQVFINRAGPSPQSAAGLAFSPDAQQQFLYVADYGNSHIVVLDRKSLQVLYQFGSAATKPGDFQGLHHLAIDSKGNLYTGEVRRASARSASCFKGLSTTLPPNALTPAQLAATPAAPAQAARGRRRLARQGRAQVPPPGQARRLPRLDQHDGQPVPRDSELAAARRHQAGRGDRHHPGRQGRHLAASPLGAADPPHRRRRARSISASATACSCRRTASARTATATSGRATAVRSRTVPATKGRGFQLFKFSPDGKVLLSLGKAGVSKADTRHVHRSDGLRDCA